MLNIDYINGRIVILSILARHKTEGFLSRTRESILISSCNVTGAIAYWVIPIYRYSVGNSMGGEGVNSVGNSMGGGGVNSVGNSMGGGEIVLEIPWEGRG